MPQPVLRTERLVLHPLSAEHLELELALEADAEVMRYVGGASTDRARVEAAHRRRLERAGRVDGLGYWTAFRGDLAEDPTADGFVGLMMLPPAHGPDQPDDPAVAELGYRLARRAWGHGFAREAASRLLEHAFATVGLRRVIAQTRTDNAASRRLLEAVGLRYVRTFRSLDDTTGGPLDVEYAVTAGEWGTAG